jgi:hypothetical protein
MANHDAIVIHLYQQMAEHTQPKCAQGCRSGPPLAFSCCDPMYCDMAIKYAKQCWDTTLEVTGHHRLPLMGPNGCTAAPHLRPLCTVHNCSINALACDPDDPEWTDEYFKLRDSIEEAEYKRGKCQI